MSDGNLLGFLDRGGLALPAGLSRSVPLPAATAPRRQRTKLWELSESVHCSIIGTCLTTGELRRAMGKVLQSDVSGVSDHDLHGQAVGRCNAHGMAAKLLQKTLDQRHETVIKRFARLDGEAAVLEAWAEARRAGDIPGAYWAVLTHPDTGHAALRKAFGDVHMLSHLVGAANRADIRRLTALERDNAALLAKVERQQVQLREAVASRDATIRRLGTLAASRVESGSSESDEDCLAGMSHLVADLKHRLDRETARRQRLEQRLADAGDAARRCEARAGAAETLAASAQRELAMLERVQAAAETSRPAVTLPPHRILYVGGRPGGVDQMRAMVKAAGGVLLSHDGGRDDHPSLLAGMISQADHVVFPVDCVSHDAALTVKRLCRQLGKRFVPLRSSGLASFLAALACDPPEQTEISP